LAGVLFIHPQRLRRTSGKNQVAYVLQAATIFFAVEQGLVEEEGSLQNDQKIYQVLSGKKLSLLPMLPRTFSYSKQKQAKRINWLINIHSISW
jgi:hypothetical protein